MKKILLILVVLVILLSLSLCGRKDVADDDLNTSSMYNETENANDETLEISVNFDLSQYDAHGELSCGLIWVEKTFSAYDMEPETYFAYFDIDGNMQSAWIESEIWHKKDFVNGILILRKKPIQLPNLNYLDSGECVIYDTEFSMLARGYFEKTEKDLAIIDANERGEVFATGEIDIDGYGEGLFMISKDGIVNFPIKTDALSYSTVENLQKIKLDNGYYIIDFRGSWNHPYYMGIFDKDGNCIFEPSEQVDYPVYSVKKVISSDRFEIMFMGKDDKYHTVITDNTGKFLTEPT